MKIRLLPLIILAYGFIIIAKISIVIDDYKPSNSRLTSIISSLNPVYVNAEETPKPDDKKEGSIAGEGNKEEANKAPAIDDRWKTNDANFDKKNSKISTTRPPEITNAHKECSEVELDLLKTLSKRREELKKWTSEAQNKENFLKAAELKVDDKLNELKSLKSEVIALLAQYNEKEDIKIKSLVKIYEAMKPKEAAQIFENLDMPVLLEVIDAMKETKVAPILANVSPQKAKDITIEFANQKKLPDSSKIK